MSDKSDLRYFCNEVANEGLVRGSSGNASCRVEPNRMIVTETGAWLGRDFYTPLCAIRPFRSLSDLYTPSSEAKAHAAIYEARKDVRVILHFQSPYATTMAASGRIHSDHRYGEINKEWSKHNGGESLFTDDHKMGNQRCDDFSTIPEIPYYIRSIGYIEQFITPGSDDLAKKLRLHFSRGENLVILANHGMFVVGKSYEETLQRALFFELACQIKVNTLSMGIEFTPLTNSTWIVEKEINGRK